MTNTRPNAISFAVALAISSSIIATDAMAERKLQTKSADILNKGRTEYTRSEVIVKPTSGNDQQPIPKSFTTTYPDQTEVRAGYDLASEGFTDILSGIDGASSVDLFETNEKDVAQKYTKVLKIGNEGIFRFTHNLAEKALVIEVRNGMTDQNSIAAVRNQLGNLQPLEPLTKVASPEQLARVLKVAHERTGKLGEIDNYVALATIEVDKVRVKGRTFMRLIAADDQPPDLSRLGQSLFVNDEVLFAAATSAYTQVHVMEEDLQQAALEDLLHHNQPVGYVVHVEDDAQTYPVPDGYPKLEVTEATGEVIVFRGQKQNPADVAFVEGLYNMWAEESCNPPSEAKTHIKKDKVRSYQHTIRSRQMVLLENLAAEQHTEDDLQSTFKYEEDFWTLIHYEYLQQALTSATSDGADEFELTVGQIEDAFPFLTPTRVLNRLEKHFSFKPALRNLLTNPSFIQTIQEEIVDDSYLNQVQDNTLEVNEELTSKPISDISRQMIEMDDKLQFLLIKELSLRHLKKEINLETQTATISEKGRLRADQLKQQINNELIQLRQERAQEKKLMQKLQQEVECNPEQSVKTHGIRVKARIARNAQMAKELGIDNWDATKPDEEQLRFIAKEIYKINQLVVAIFTATVQSDDKTVKAKPSATGREPGIAPVKAFSLGYLQSIQQLLRQNREVTDEKVWKRLAIVESKLSLVPDYDKDPEARCQAILQHLKAQEDETAQQPLRQQSTAAKLQREPKRIPKLERKIRDARADATKIRNAQIAAELGIDNWDDTQPPEEQARRISRKVRKFKQAEAAKYAAAAKSDKEAVKAKRTTIADRHQLILVNEDDLGSLLFIHNQLQQNSELPNEEVRERLATFERQLGLVPNNEDGLEARRRNILKRLKQQGREVFQQHFQNQQEQEAEQVPSLAQQVHEARTGATKVRNAQPGIDGRDNTEQAILISQKVHEVEQPVVATGQPGEEALKEKLAAIEKALKMDHHDCEDDVYYRRNAISEEIQTYITEAGKKAEKESLEILETVEEIFEVEVNQDDHKATRLERVLTKLNSGDVSEFMLDEIDAVVCKIDSSPGNQIAKKIEILQKFITFHVETPDVDGQVTRQQRMMLEAVEDELNIDTGENPSAKERGKGFAAELALDLAVEFEKGASLNDQKYALSNKIQILREKVNDHYDTEDLTRDTNNEIAWQLNIEGYMNDAPLEDQISLIEKTLQELDEEVDIIGRPKIYDRIAAIENELDRQMTCLGKIQYVPDNEDDTTLYQVMNVDIDEKSKTLHEHEIARQEGEIESGKADIEGMEEALKADEKAAENDGSPFQYTPGQAEALEAFLKFSRQHPLTKQALEAAVGLAQSAVARGKPTPCLSTFNFYDEFAPIRLYAMFGYDLNQARRIAEVFKSLKTTFWEYPYDSLIANQIQLINTLEEIQTLTQKVTNEMGKGTQQYDDEIHRIGSAGTHFVEHSAEDQKSFSEYFSTHTASGKKIISLLREGLISKVELENYMKAIRGVDGYQTVAEFEHFLGYKHGVKARVFRKIIRMLPDKDAEELIQSAFTPVVVAATGPTGIKESVAGVTDYTAAVIANYVLDDIAFENGRKTAAFLTNVQDTLTPYANAVGLSESDLIKIFHDTLMQAHAAAVEQQLKDYWIKPSASLAQVVTWYYSSYKPLLVANTAWQAVGLSLSHMSYLYLLDLTNRGDYLHRMLTPFQNWMEGYGIDLDRTGQSAYHNGIEQISEVGGLAMPLGKAASSVILLRTSSMLFARQYNANPHSYRSINRLVPEIVQSMNSGGIQVPLLHRVTPQKVKTLASATAGLVLGPVATVGSYAHGLVSGFTYAQTFGFALATSLTYDFFMNDNKMLTQWLAGPLGRSLDKINRWQGVGETDNEYVKRTAVVSPQGFSESDEEYVNRVKASNSMLGWTRQENYLQFRERRDRTMKMFENSWEKYFREYVPKWSFSHAESFPYFYTLGALYEWRWGDDQKVRGHNERNVPQPDFLTDASGD
ncbi:hypothetical protein [Endozoicomonas sp. 8E]|uniref:hypothetical protein n=1 Tax=Endozoicomonas sp. 8E TaxID=3035692 RepID=UPI0029395427|nr:hypothetical protein [Endozoicomonas sp. 8E]WOG29620.1 hypothetical protein P6910_08190 [Endozoicomonas sp. 8E]